MRPAPTSIYTLSLHDALPISQQRRRVTERFLRGLRVRGEINQGALVGGLDFNHWGRQLDLPPLFSHHLAQTDRASRLGCAGIAKRSTPGADRVPLSNFGQKVGW